MTVLRVFHQQCDDFSIADSNHDDILLLHANLVNIQLCPFGTGL